MRTPSPTIVVDAAVLVAAARGRSSGAVSRAAQLRALVTTGRAVEEARRRIELGLRNPDLLTLVDDLIATITVVPAASIEPLLAASEVALRDAVASRNGSTKDAHVLALAWCTGADVWTTDRDFAGTGVATWSTPNLMRALAEAASDNP